MNLTKLIVSVGVFAFLAAPVFANEPAPAAGETTAAPAAEEHGAGHGDAHKAAKTAKKGGKKAKKEAHPTEGTEAPAPHGH